MADQNYYSSLRHAPVRKAFSSAYENQACELDVEAIQMEPPPLKPRNRITSRTEEMWGGVGEKNLGASADPRGSGQRPLAAGSLRWIIIALVFVFLISSGSAVVTTLLLVGRIPLGPNCSCSGGVSGEGG